MANNSIELIKKEAENSLISFIKLIHPQRVLGAIHEELINWWCRSDAKTHQLVLLPRDHSKVLPWDAPVLLANGEWKATGDIRVGDILADPTDGKSQVVTQLHPVMEDDYYKLTLDDGREIECGAGHLWEIEQHGFKEGPIVRDTLWIIDHYKKERFEPRTGNYFTEYKSALRATAPLHFEEQDLPIEPYVLGAWLTSQDSEIIASYGYILSKLREIGVLNNKHIPDVYLKGSLDQRLELLKGLLDTDGTIGVQSKTISFTQCAERESLVDQVSYLVRSLGGKSKKSFDKNTNSYTINIWIPEEVGVPFKVAYKAARYNFKPQKLKSWIKDIKYVGKKFSRCISVSCEKGLYITNNFIVTHNSAMVAYRVAWELTKDPSLRVLYISSTANLATKQLKFIKDIFTNKKYKKYWPEMVHEDEGRREKWTETEIALDHPIRRREAIRDPSIFTAGLTTGITGLHCDIAVLDDVVVRENAYTREGRQKVQTQYSMLSSIEAGDAREWIVGTRYDPNDLYQDLQTMEIEKYDKKGNVISEEPLYEVFERQVEDNGDGTGEFLWPRQQRYDGKWFGFNQEILAKKRAQYLDRTQFYCQYYNRTDIAGNGTINVDCFQYYDRKVIYQVDSGDWYIRDKKLKVYAAIDFAFSLRGKADSTALVVVGVDEDSNYYVLDIDRFKSDKVSVYYSYIFNAVSKWGFRKIRAEINVAQKVIVNTLRDHYIKPSGIPLSIDEINPTKHDGTKEERINAILEPRYDNRQIWHYKGGNCQSLEEELKMERPPHDDIKDALANAVDLAKPPVKSHKTRHVSNNVVYHSRFGGCV